MVVRIQGVDGIVVAVAPDRIAETQKMTMADDLVRYWVKFHKGVSIQSLEVDEETYLEVEKAIGDPQ